MTSSAHTAQLVVVAGAIVGLVGAIIAAIGSRALYDQIGGGRFALDVSDGVPPPPPESAAGRAELRQLEEALAAVRAARSTSTRGGGDRESAGRPEPYG
jgi:hypothetical protein